MNEINNQKNIILNTIFGHQSFRNYQEEIVDSILQGQDLLTILPTGGGKSLCYQLPTLLMSGVTVVISPLIALMQDQIKALQALNIKASMISSLQTPQENQETIEQVLNGQLQFIYVAPERFTSNEFVQTLQQVNINYFVIDEAHCVSAWGHEFRAEYRNLDRLKQYFPQTPIAAFTATATKKVEEDISFSLNLNKPKHFRSKTQRDNLIITTKPRIANGQKQILDFLKSHQGLCGIIYTFTRKEAEKTAEFLQKKGYKAKAYHAALSVTIKNQVFHDFIYEDIDIVVATIAFGMGIDKSNIRFVLHTSMPKTLENYYQEIGRAGRDGENAYVHLLYSKSDEVKRKIQIEEGINNEYKTTALEKLEKMYRYCISNHCRHQLIANYFDDEIPACETLCDNCTKGEVEMLNCTLSSQKFLSAIARTQQKFGMNHIIDILRASKNQKLLDQGHEKLSVYGLGRDKSKNEWIAIADCLIDMNAISIGEFRVLKLNALASNILKGQEEVFIDSSKQGLLEIEEKEEKVLSFNEQLFEQFRTLRHDMAQEREVPAYVIFGDKTLKELSSKLPTTKDAMLEVNGIGEVKFEKFGEAFLNLCQNIKDEHKEKLNNQKELKKLTKTYLETFDLIEEGKSVEEIAMIRDLSLSSILNHLQVLSEHEKVSHLKKEELLKPLEIPKEIIQWIEKGLEYENLNNLKQYLYLYDYLKKANHE